MQSGLEYVSDMGEVVFCADSVRAAVELLRNGSMMVSLMNKFMLCILSVAVLYILAHFVLTAVIISRLLLVAICFLVYGKRNVAGNVGCAASINKLCPKYDHDVADPDQASQCAVCLEGFEIGSVKRKLTCSHEFHARCIDMWFRKANRCPLCLRCIVPPEQLSLCRDSRQALLDLHRPWRQPYQLEESLAGGQPSPPAT